MGVLRGIAWILFGTFLAVLAPWAMVALLAYQAARWLVGYARRAFFLAR